LQAYLFFIVKGHKDVGQVNQSQLIDGY